MKLLVITHEYPPIGGGGANACKFLTKEFAKAGNDVTVVTAQYNDLPWEETTDDKVKIYRVKCIRADREKSSFLEMFTYLIGANIKIEMLLKTESYDRCLVFFGIPSGPLALKFKKKYDIPYYIRFGGGDIPGTQARFAFIYKLLSPALRIIWREADGLVANSYGLQQRALQFENRYSISIIENGVDNQLFKPIKHVENKCIRILFVSRLLERKGLQFIIPNLKEINEQVREKCGKEIRLSIVGDGPYREKLENLADEMEVGNLVKFEGRKEKEQLLSIYPASDLFILPSQWEGMPNVVLEAMASGLPIIMTPCEGSKELVTNNGIISTIEDFKDNIIKLCSDEELRQSMGKNSLENIERNFQWESIGKRYIQLMQRCEE